MRHVCSPALILLLFAGVSSAQQQSSPPAAAGAGATRLNLARTSLATVSASSVNGRRALDNEFYGIQKAFDDGGMKGDNGINYNYWMAEAGEFRPWVIVQFKT